MKEWLKKVTGWFTPAKRAALYAIAVAIVPFAQQMGWVNDVTGEAWLTITSVALQVLAGTLMLLNLDKTSAASWFTERGRAVIYATLAGVAPALQAIGLFTEEQAEVILQNVSHGLGVLVAIVAALYIKPVSPEPSATIYVDGHKGLIGAEVADPQQ